MDERWRVQVEAIRSDNRSGAAELTRRAASFLADFFSEAGAEWVDFFALARALVRAQPSMAPILNLVNDLLWAAGDATVFHRRREYLADLSLHAASKDVISPIADQLSSLVSETRRVVTLSHSSTLRQALALLRERGIEYQVTCAEGRPMFEGRSLAQALAEDGVRVRLVSDAGIYDQVVPQSVVLVGADAVRPESFTNKAGTWALALAGRERGAPIYVVAEGAKFVPAGVPLRARLEDPGQLWPESIAEVEVVNVYFEEIPLVLLDGIVTEAGVLTPAEAARAASSVEVYPGLWSTEPYAF